jgi:hypothetical protein
MESNPGHAQNDGVKADVTRYIVGREDVGVADRGIHQVVGGRGIRSVRRGLVLTWKKVDARAV